ncbi:hypothetical protein Pcinc_041731 [Petrolisthes cinctipes]|uniref:Uncharacterized protein n=1 Tax=Petrolisthes cinctipes TaxID=88211 RepID=A0AAE1BLG2_PETCI|nr:hypothetical protein Pcinc_041731 [Petrolisthes cinctipes]
MEEEESGAGEGGGNVSPAGDEGGCWPTARRLTGARLPTLTRPIHPTQQGSPTPPTTPQPPGNYPPTQPAHNPNHPETIPQPTQ